MNKTTLNNAPRVPFDMEGYIMHKSDSLELIHLCLKPNQQIPQHSNSFDVVACLVEGSVNLDIDKDSTLLNKYDVVTIEKDVLRGFSNFGNSEARLLIMKKL